MIQLIKIISSSVKYVLKSSTNDNYLCFIYFLFIRKPSEKHPPIFCQKSSRKIWLYFYLCFICIFIFHSVSFNYKKKKRDKVEFFIIKINLILQKRKVGKLHLELHLLHLHSILL